jgi:hypothetical protein
MIFSLVLFVHYLFRYRLVKISARLVEKQKNIVTFIKSPVFFWPCPGEIKNYNQENTAQQHQTAME